MTLTQSLLNPLRVVQEKKFYKPKNISLLTIQQWIKTSNTLDGQQSFRVTQNLWQIKISIIPIDYPTHAHEKYRGAIHTHMEKPLHWRTLWCWENVPNSHMVPSPQTSTNNIKPIEAINIKSKTLSTNVIGGGGGGVQQDTPHTPTPVTKVVIHDKPGQNNPETHMGYRDVYLLPAM